MIEPVFISTDECKDGTCEIKPKKDTNDMVIRAE
jgi:hypothetical protein